MGRLAATGREDSFLLVVDFKEEWPVAVAEPGEERGQGVVVVLGPAFAGVVVALGRADSHAEEKLGDLLGSRPGVAEQDAEDIADGLHDRQGFTIAQGVVGLLQAVAWGLLVRALTTRHSASDGRVPGALNGAPVSERSERTIITVFIAALRRCAHWCPVEFEAVTPPHTSVVHQ